MRLRNHEFLRSICLLFICTLTLSSTSGGEPKARGVYWLVYDVKTPGALQVCSRRTGNQYCSCTPWQNAVDSFHSNSLIRLGVIHGRFRDTFAISLFGTSLPDLTTEIRGASTTPPLSVPAPPQQPLPALALEATFPDKDHALAALLSKYDAANKAVNDTRSLIGDTGNRSPGECSVKPAGRLETHPGPVQQFAQSLRDDAEACLKNNPKVFAQEDVFNSLTDRADLLNQIIALFKASSSDPSSLQSLAAQAKAAFDAFDSLAQSVNVEVKDPKTPIYNDEELKPYLPEGETYQDLYQRLNVVTTYNSTIPQTINSASNEAFALIDSLYFISESREPFDAPIGEFSSNYTAQFSIVELPHFTPYPLSSGKPQDQGPPGPQPQQPPAEAPTPDIGDPFKSDSAVTTAFSNRVIYRSAVYTLSPVMGIVVAPPAAQKAPGPSTAKDAAQVAGGPTQAKSQPVGKVIYTAGDIDVHHFSRGNLVAGFFASSLRNRQYGVTNNGQASSSTGLLNVAIVGPVTRPQYHAFVAVDIYLWERDLSPEIRRQKKRFHLQSKWYRSAWMPALMTGYGVDSLNNYVEGLNWETAIGLDFGSGLHIGQESYLAPGIVPGVTQLPSTSTSPPTIQVTKYGMYGSLSLDFGTMKTLIAKVFGGGGGS
jgi:hypothetical protein